MSREDKPATIDRRTILGACTALAGYAALNTFAEEKSAYAALKDEEYTPSLSAENFIYTACLQCNTQCTQKAKIQNGVLTKVDGNPYSPMTFFPHIAYNTLPEDAAVIDGAICPKGQSGVQTLYDPYRLRKVLKRAGPRGSSKWKTIPFEQAIKEICEGGQLFSDIGEKHHVSGFKEVIALRDPQLAEALAADANAVRRGQMTVQSFKEKNAQALPMLLDPEHPDLGPKNNQFVLMGGRITPDREYVTQRFTYGAVGSVNWFGHTSICEAAHHVGYEYCLASWKKSGDSYTWVRGPNHMKPDLAKSEFIIFWGTGFCETNFGPTSMSPRVAKPLADGKLKIAVIDPRLSKSAAKGWWIPVHPNGNLALAMGMIRWIIENKCYDEAFLQNANQAAAKAGGEICWSNAAWLVNPKTGKFLRASEIGIGTADQFVALSDNTPVAVEPSGATASVVGELDVAATLQGIQVVSGFRMLKDAVFAQTMEDYAKVAGLDVSVIENLAREFTSHGKKAAIEFYRGPIKTTFGYYTVQAMITLNFLIGNVDHVGGLMKGGGAWNGMGASQGQPFPLGKMHPKALKAFGVRLTREASGQYETSTLFKRDGYPAKRPWFPFTSSVYQEVIPAAYAEYPYPIKILLLHYGTPVMGTPAGHLQIKMLQDTAKIPLFICSDVVIGETSIYADYIFPDLAYLERWSNPISTHPTVLTQTSKFRQPTVAPIPEIVTIDGEQMPISIDSVLLAIAKYLGLSGFGENAFGSGLHLNRPEDLYLKMIANLAVGGKPGDEAPVADDAELTLLRNARRHLPKAVFDEEKWRSAAGEHWRRVVYLLNRGGRFEAAGNAYDGKFAKHPLAGQLNIYVEAVAVGIHSIQNRRYYGVPHFETMESFDGKPVEFPSDCDMELITYKDIHAAHSRTAGNYVAQWAIGPENYVFIHPVDGTRLGLKDGDVVRLESKGFNGQFDIGPGQAPGKVQGKIRLIQGIRPGVVGVSWHYGHWAYGARDVEINGVKIPGEAIRGKGLLPNPAMAVDGYLKDVCLTDPIAGDSAFTGTKVKLLKVTSSTDTPLPPKAWVPLGWASDE